jgi:hypothetical protein
MKSAEIARAGFEIIRGLLPLPGAAHVSDKNVAAGIDLLLRGVHFRVIRRNGVRAASNFDPSTGNHQAALGVVGKVFRLNINEVAAASGGGNGRGGGARRNNFLRRAPYWQARG